METKLSARAIAGQRYRVKRNPITRKYGVNVRCGNRLDCKAWPGEVGTVVERTWTAWSGEPMAALFLEFERGRDCSVDTADLADFLLTK